MRISWLGGVVAAWAVGGAAGCFKPALEREVVEDTDDGDGGPEVEVEVEVTEDTVEVDGREVAETGDNQAPETVGCGGVAAGCRVTMAPFGLGGAVSTPTSGSHVSELGSSGASGWGVVFKGQQWSTMPSLGAGLGPGLVTCDASATTLSIRGRPESMNQTGGR